MKQILSLLLLITSTCLMSQNISIQGVLRDAKGRTVADGDYQVTFSLYESLTGGSALYTETHPAVTTSQGLFAALLGAEGAPDTLSSLPFDTTYYLGIQIEGKAELEPRTELTLSPYAKSVRGGDNQFPSTGNVNIKTKFTIDLGNVYLAEGDVLVKKGGLTLDSGIFTINLGDIQLTDAGGAIRFPDGTILNSAEGGTASSAGNIDTLSIIADSDMDSTGGIEFQIGVQPVMTIRNDGLVTMEAGLKIDSGRVLYQGDRDIHLGHYALSDSSFTSHVTMGYDSTVKFAYAPQSLDSAEADTDAFTLGYLKNVVEEKLTPYQRQTPEQSIGDSFGGGTVFAVEEDYIYIAYKVSFSDELTNLNIVTLSGTSPDFGAGYDNTETILATTGSSSSSYITYYLRNGDYGGYNDWFIPSREEMLRIHQELPSFFSSGTYTATSTSGYSGTGSGECGTTGNTWVDLYYNGNTSCYSPTQTMNWVFARRIPVDYGFNTSDPDDFVTAGVLQKNRSSFVENSYQLGDVIGEGNDQGTIFARTADTIYIAKYVSNAYYQTYHTSSSYSWSSSGAFGAGYANTQAMIASAQAYNSSLYSSEWSYQLVNYHPNWHLPSVDELKAVLDSLPSGFAPAYTTLWTSNYYSSSSGTIVYTDPVGKFSYTDYSGRSNSRSAILIQKIPVGAEDRNIYSTNTSNLVTWAYYNARMAGLERKLNRAIYAYNNRNTSPTYSIGQEVEGGTVFAKNGGYVYIAYEYQPGSTFYFGSYTTNTSTAFGSGYDNTQNILSAYSTTSTSYIEGILRQTINGYNDWFIPSKEELQSVLDNTTLGTSYSSYYIWTSSQEFCSSGDYQTLYYNGGESCYDYYDSNYLILVRRVPAN